MGHVLSNNWEREREREREREEEGGKEPVAMR
jgi:hypothetical protein